MALPNDVSRIAQGLSNYSASSSDVTAAKAAGKTFIRRTITLRKPAADAMAADATAYTAAEYVRMMNPGRVIGACLCPQTAANIGDDTDFATVNVVKADGAAGADTVMASRTTKITGGTDDLAAGVLETLTVSSTLADTRFTAGQVIGFSITKDGAGQVVPICSIDVDIEIEGVDGYGA